MGISKQKFNDWLKTETEKFRKSKPKGATHYKIGKRKIKWYQLRDGFFFKYSEKKKSFNKAVPLCWDNQVLYADW